MTGSGKSVLTEVYLSQFPRVIKLDTKGEALERLREGKSPWEYVPNKQLAVVFHFEDIAEVAQTHPYIIYCPDYTELNMDGYERFFKWCYNEQNITVWVDETMQISPNPHVIPDHYKAILTRGRSRNTAVWSCSQRPKGIASIIITQCTHVFAFTMTNEDDRKAVAKNTGVADFQFAPSWHSFKYWRVGWDRCVTAKLKIA
jgi:hypothetical protein